MGDLWKPEQSLSTRCAERNGWTLRLSREVVNPVKDPHINYRKEHKRTIGVVGTISSNGCLSVNFVFHIAKYLTENSGEACKKIAFVPSKYIKIKNV